MVLTNHETELMNFFWSLKEPVTGKDILEQCKEHTWADTYLGLMLRSLEQKGAIRCCGIKLYGKRYARQFESIITKEEYFVQLAKDNGVDMKAFARAAAGLAKKEAPEDQEKLIGELENIIKEFREKE